MRSTRERAQGLAHRIGLGVLIGVALLPVGGGVALACPPSPSGGPGHNGPSVPSWPSLPGLPPTTAPTTAGTPAPVTPVQPAPAGPISDVPCAAAVAAQDDVDVAQARVDAINAELGQLRGPLFAAQGQLTNDQTIYGAYLRQQGESRLALDRATAALAAAQAGGDPAEVAAAQARVDQAQAELDRNNAGVEQSAGPARESGARVAALQPRYDELEQAAWNAQRDVYAAQNRAGAVVCETATA